MTGKALPAPSDAGQSPGFKSHGARTPETSSERPRHRVWLGLAVLMLTAIGLVIAWRVTRPADVEIHTVRTSTIERVLAVVGRARPGDLLDVRSPNAGQVIRLFHDDGDRVALNEPLASIKATVQQADIDAGNARVRAARAERDRVRLVFNRTRILAGRGIAAPAALDEARATLQAAEANLDAADAATTAAMERASAFIVRAPMAGIVLYRPIDTGQVVSPTTNLFQLGSIGGSEIQAQVDEAYADALHPGLIARAVLTGSDQTFQARVTEVSPQIDSTTGGRLVKLVPIDGPVLAPGRSIDVSIVVDRRADAIVIPRQAVIDPSTNPRVYVVDAANVARVRSITILRWPSIGAIVQSGLSAGDRIVLTPGWTRPGAHVRPITSSAHGDR